MENIKSFEDACVLKGLSPTDLPVVDHLPAKHRAAIVGFYKMTIIAEALNRDWVADYNDEDQPKYEPWFVIETNDEGESSLVCHDVYYWYTHTLAGSRLCYRDRATAVYAATQFKELYESFFLIK